MEKLTWTQKQVLRFWKPVSGEIDFPAFFEKPKKTLLILPRDEKERGEITSLHKKIIAALERFELTVLDYGYSADEAHKWAANVVMWNERHIGICSRVKSPLLGQLIEKQFDMAIDLSQRFDFVTAQLPLRAKIPARIGFSNTDFQHVANSFFNISIVCKDNGIAQLLHLLGQ